MILGGRAAAREPFFTSTRTYMVQKNKREQNSGNAGALFGGGN